MVTSDIHRLSYVPKLRVNTINEKKKEREGIRFVQETKVSNKKYYFVISSFPQIRLKSIRNLETSRWFLSQLAVSSFNHLFIDNLLFLHSLIKSVWQLIWNLSV